MAFEFVVDHVVKRKAYPALAQWQARPFTQSWREFGSHWPWTTPLRMEEYCHEHDVRLDLFLPDNYPPGAWYPICLGFFDFTVDYMELLPWWTKQALQAKMLRLLFMYHEGDNPVTIRARLDRLCDSAGLSRDCYAFVTSNTSAQRMDRFVVFHDFELWYYQRNKNIAPSPVTDTPRSKDFLCLSRVHKSWRAAVMADLWRNNLLDNSYFSYCHRPESENFHDSPIQLDLIPQLRLYANKFLQQAPFFCDDFSDQARNDHSQHAHDLFADTYCNIVIESQFDVDGSGGVFLTEKTFKPIKHGQLFFVVGAAGSLQALRDLGYRTFDHVLDNSYDVIEDPTLRWQQLIHSIKLAKTVGLDKIYQQCLADLSHNQQHFLQAPRVRLNTLMQQLTTQ